MFERWRKKTSEAWTNPNSGYGVKCECPQNKCVYLVNLSNELKNIRNFASFEQFFIRIRHSDEMITGPSGCSQYNAQFVFHVLVSHALDMKTVRQWEREEKDFSCLVWR